MRHSDDAKNNVRKLRLNGLSLDKIHKETDIPKTTIRSWVKTISLTDLQIETLKNSTQKALQEGREKKQKLEKKLKLKNEKSLREKGINEITTLTKRELLIAGSALYWAEGFKNKHEHRLGFCNSDPDMIRFYITWLKQVFGIIDKEIVLRLSINESYKDNVEMMEKYWSDVTKIPTSQFSKTFYQKSKWKKQYNTNNYRGILRIHVKSSLNSLLLVKGFIEGLKLNLNK